MVLALGGFWWGEVVSSDADLDRPVLSATALTGAGLDLLVSRADLPGADGLWTSVAWLAPVLFLWASSTPALLSAAFPDGRGQSRGLFLATALALAGVAAGLVAGLEPALRPTAQTPPLVADAIMIALALLAWPWSRTAGAASGLRPWPTYNLGVFKGKVYGQDLAVSGRLAKTVVPATFLGALAAGAGLSPFLWAPDAALWSMPTAWLVMAAAGALILGPMLAIVAAPVTAPGLALTVLALGLGLGSELAARLDPGGPFGPYIAVFFPLAALGALRPLSARIQVARSERVAPAMGRFDMWLLTGLAVGVAAAIFDLRWRPGQSWPALAAWGGALVALAPRLGKLLAFILWLAILALTRLF